MCRKDSTDERSNVKREERENVDFTVGSLERTGFFVECLPQFECSEIWRIVRKHKAAGAISEYG